MRREILDPLDQQVRPVLMVMMDRLVPREIKAKTEPPEPKEILDQRVILEQLVQKGRMGRLEPEDQSDQPVQLARKDHKVRLDHKVILDRKVKPELMAVMEIQVIKDRKVLSRFKSLGIHLRL